MQNAQGKTVRVYQNTFKAKWRRLLKDDEYWKIGKVIPGQQPKKKMAEKAAAAAAAADVKPSENPKEWEVRESAPKLSKVEKPSVKEEL